MPKDSKTNRLLRYGSRQAPKQKPENDKFKYRNSLPVIRKHDGIIYVTKNGQKVNNNDQECGCHTDGEIEVGMPDQVAEEKAKITVHRTLS